MRVETMPTTPVATLRQPSGVVIKGFDSSNSGAPHKTIQHETEETHHIDIKTSPKTIAPINIHLKCFISFMFLQAAYTMICYAAGQRIVKAITDENDIQVLHMLISSAAPSIAISLKFSCMSAQLFAAQDEIATATKKILISAIKYLTLSAILTSLIDYALYISLPELSSTLIGAATLGATFKAIEVKCGATKRGESQGSNVDSNYRVM